MIRVQVTCEGLTPLLMNPLSDEDLENLRTRTRKPKVTDRTAEEEASEKLYKDSDGNIGIPQVNLFSCLVAAGREVILAGRTKVSTATSTKLPSLLTIEEVFFPLIEGSDWIVDKRRGRNPNGGEAVCLVRPKFEEWAFVCTLEIDEVALSEESAKELFRIAGTSVGLCDFRPACKGPFGRFKVGSWVRLDESDAGSSNGRVDRAVLAAA